MADANLQYYSSATGLNFLFQANIVKTRSANFHEYSWSPDVFTFDYGAQVKQFGKEPITYTATLNVFGSPNDKRTWLDSFRAACDLDIVSKRPGRLYWGDMFLECYILQTSTEPLEKSTAVENTIGIFAPYPSWIYEITYADEWTFTKAQIEALLNRINPRIDLMHYDISASEHWAPFHALPSDFRAILVGTGAATDASIDITSYYEEDGYLRTSVTAIEFIPSELVLGASECLVVDSRHEKKTATVYTIDDGEIDAETGVNVYNLRKPNSHLFRKILTTGGTTASLKVGIADCYSAAGQNVILTVYFERSEPTWIS